MADTSKPSRDDKGPVLERRELLAYTAAFGAAFVAKTGLAQSAAAGETKEKPVAAPSRRYDMKKSINMWALPYPDKMSLTQCFELLKDAGFDGVEINYALEGEFSPEATPQQIEAIGKMARKIGIDVSGVCSFLFWPYSLTHNDPERRKKGMEFAVKMIEAAKLLGVKNLLTIPGAVYIPWLDEVDPVPNDVCDRRAREAIAKLVPIAEKAGVLLNIENIFSSGYLFSPQEMVQFVDSFNSPNVQIHFDTGNTMEYQFPEHWIPILGKRIKNVHLKEYKKGVHEAILNSFRPLLDGTTNWPAVLAALDKVGYRGYLTFEYFTPYEHWPEALVYQTSDSLDRMLGRK